ncbi:MAG: hypothetical protein HGB29_09600 [Chlorobiaceae bacterium]|nr:hypothetical protein [Chlorobiaceae bacterium]NTW75105.1 hypothetical protein [Chlorobiaceae bacterium]
MDQMYTIAFWMTGSLQQTYDLVYKTYERVNSHTSDIGLFRAFKEVYNEDFSRKSTPPPYPSSDPAISILRQQDREIRLAVLLVEVCELHYHEIAIIMEQPIETIRLWLSSGRKTFLASSISFAIAG